ncbi:MAG: mechanosensitive ion channel family protein [Propionibacteriaceae bacterium]|jgi:small conductance mechanosensitive channel|nr:mechanosensitive ion channel family protein [Propionibacteriaceae bacterium]
MESLELTWVWPRSLIVIGVTLAVAVVGYIAGTWLIRRTVRQVERAVKRHDDAVAAAADGAPPPGPVPRRTVRRVKVIASLTRSIWTALLVLFVLLGLLHAVGVSVTPLLASAGVASVIVGLGAQSLIKDLLAGLFLIAEDQYGIGDVITVGSLTGRVERVSLRITELRDAGGMLWFVRNGEILTVGNISQGKSTAVVDVPVAYGVDVDRAAAVLRDAAAEVAADPDLAAVILEAPTVLGVEAISVGAVTFRLTAPTAPNQQWPVQRALRAKALAALRAADFPPPAADAAWLAQAAGGA